jgi:hypothetical protein
LFATSLATGPRSPRVRCPEIFLGRSPRVRCPEIFLGVVAGPQYGMEAASRAIRKRSRNFESAKLSQVDQSATSTSEQRSLNWSAKPTHDRSALSMIIGSTRPPYARGAHARENSGLRVRIFLKPGVEPGRSTCPARIGQVDQSATSDTRARSTGACERTVNRNQLPGLKDQRRYRSMCRRPARWPRCIEPSPHG